MRRNQKDLPEDVDRRLEGLGRGLVSVPNRLRHVVDVADELRWEDQVVVNHRLCFLALVVFVP